MIVIDGVSIIPRLATRNDTSFIYSVWLRSYKHDSPITQKIHSDIFFEEHQIVLDRLLSDQSVMVALAVDEDDPKYILGFIAFEPKTRVMHFAYTKKPMREFGIFNMLCEVYKIPKDLEGWEASHLTNTLLDLWGKRKMKCRYNPYSMEKRK